MKHSTTKSVEILEKRMAQLPVDPSKIPLWRDGARAIPNAMARSALFRAAAKGRERRVLIKERINAVDGIDITMTGLELSQEDGDVFLQVVHMLRGQACTEPIHTNGRTLLTALDKHASSQDYQRLKDSLRRLQGAQLVLRAKVGTRNVEYVGNLISYLVFSDEIEDAKSTEWEIQLNGKMVNLFAGDVYTRVDWKQRLQLTPLAKWLHSFYSSQPNCFGYKVETFYELCGSVAGELKSFKQKLKMALDQLVAEEFLESWEIDGKIVNVKRVGPNGPTQGRLL